MNFDVMFPDKRAEGETRLKQCQHVMLRMLKIFDALCRKHNIEYFLIGGSLLGAVRHKGFIPWDDDLDVGMTRANYEKFEKLAAPELPNDIFFQTPATDVHYPSCIRVEARLRDKYSTYALSETQKANPWHQGLQVDIFIYYRAYLPSNAFIYAHNRLLQMMLWKKGPNNQSHIHRARIQKLIELLPLPLVYASSFICTKNMIKMGTNYIRSAEIKQLLMMPFEDMQVPVPVGWDACLRRQYGDYMQLPPEEKRSVFHGIGEPDPFTPCDHTEILHWQNRPQQEPEAA